MAASESTRPVASNLSFEAYCEALGIDANDTRTASVVRSLYYRIRRTDAYMRPFSDDSQDTLKDDA